MTIAQEIEIRKSIDRAAQRRYETYIRPAQKKFAEHVKVEAQAILNDISAFKNVLLQSVAAYIAANRWSIFRLAGCSRARALQTALQKATGLAEIIAAVKVATVTGNTDAYSLKTFLNTHVVDKYFVNKNQFYRLKNAAEHNAGDSLRVIIDILEKSNPEPRATLIIK